MDIEVFLKTINNIGRGKFQDAVADACGKVNPLKDPTRFRNVHKSGVVRLVPILRRAIHAYFVQACGAVSLARHPNDVVKQVTMELQLRRAEIPVVVRLLRKHFPNVIDEKTVCQLGCKVDFNCYHDHRGNSEVCATNFCHTCRGKASISK